MALLNCPECNNSVSDSAETCPHCGYKLAENRTTKHIPKVSNLSKKRKHGIGKSLIMFIGSCILIAAGVPLIALGIGVILIILGIVGFFAALTEVKKYQYGDCPYCGIELRVVTGNNNFQCPICHNVGVQTAATLETTHDYTPVENK